MPRVVPPALDPLTCGCVAALRIDKEISCGSESHRAACVAGHRIEWWSMMPTLKMRGCVDDLVLLHGRLACTRATTAITSTTYHRPTRFWRTPVWHTKVCMLLRTSHGMHLGDRLRRCCSRASWLRYNTSTTGSRVQLEAACQKPGGYVKRGMVVAVP